MPINHHFSFYTNKQEQTLVEDLINESLAMFGFEAFYVPKNESIQPDLLYGDDPLKAFIDAYPIHVYLTNSRDSGMNRDFFTKFGLEIKNSVRVLLSKRIFDRMVKNNPFERPAEGDLIYIPWLSGTGELYEITYTNDSSDFFILGRKYPYYWELELELFKYSHEQIETGIPQINTVSEDQAFSIMYEMDYPFPRSNQHYFQGEKVYQEHYPFFFKDENGDSKEVDVNILDHSIIIVDKAGVVYEVPITNDKLPVYSANGEQADINVIKTAEATVLDWNATSQTLKLNLISGVFLPDYYVYGQDSGAAYKVVKYNPIDIPFEKDSADNYNLQKYSQPIVNTDESNPFGVL